MLQRDFKVVSKGLKGKHQTPFVTLITAEGDKLTLHFEDKRQLDNFQIEQIFTVKILQEQTTLHIGSEEA
jgi:hypothetical protein